MIQPRVSTCHNTIRMWVMAIACLGFISMGCQHQQLQSQPESQPKPEKNQLVYRVNQYYEALHAREYAKTRLYSAHMRPQRPSEQSSLGAKVSFQLATYEIQSINIHQLEAQVIMHVTVRGLDCEYEMVLVDRWQYLGDNWFVVDSIQSPSEDSIQSLDQKIWRNRITW